jgi:AraC-like DNA-binding protein
MTGALPVGEVWSGRGTGVVERILPDGCSDIIWLDGQLVVAGPDTTAQMHRARPGSINIGLRFGPGQGPALFGVPARELVDQRVPLDQFWEPARVRQLTQAIADAIGADPEGHRAGQALVTATVGQLGAPAPDPRAELAATLLATGVGVDAVAEELALSPRQLRRQAHDWFGYGPKLLARILRFKRAVGQAQRGRPFAEVAATNGYADQAHLARDVRSLAGTNLRTLL